MNCNDAFDRLTSPDAALDVELQRHLAECRRCRAMQETLSPALEWLTESPLRSEGTVESSDRRSPFLSEEAVQVAERAARRLMSSRASSPPSGARRRSIAFWFAAGASLCLLALAVLPSRSSSADPARSAVSPPSSTGCLWFDSASSNSNRHLSAPADEVVSTCVACHLTTP
jgi:hypothetical protein